MVPPDPLPLTEREKEALRLLAGGHDVKSMARHLGLSVHTITERLRDTRRALGVSSSREAARRLLAAEGGEPTKHADRVLGVAGDPAAVAKRASAALGIKLSRVAWFAGGMFVMSLVIAAAIVVATSHGGGTTAVPPVAAPAADTTAVDAAQDWLGLVDRRQRQEGWPAVSTIVKASLTADQWAEVIQAARRRVGPVETRTLASVVRATTLPGVPPGDYEVIQFRTALADKPQATETVTLAHEDGAWKVAGYFIR